MTRRGQFPYWTKDGGIYNTAADCKSALKTRGVYPPFDPDDVAIIEYELVYKGHVKK